LPRLSLRRRVEFLPPDFAIRLSNPRVGFRFSAFFRISDFGFRPSPLLPPIIAFLIDKFNLSNDFHHIVSLDPLPLRRKDGFLSDLPN